MIVAISIGKILSDSYFIISPKFVVISVYFYSVFVYCQGFQFWVNGLVFHFVNVNFALCRIKSRSYLVIRHCEVERVISNIVCFVSQGCVYPLDCGCAEVSKIRLHCA